MVHRWLVTQEYDFKLEDILGINLLVDGIRPVANNMTPAVTKSFLKPNTRILIHNDRESPQRESPDHGVETTHANDPY
jgi:hypothetical protein